MWDVSHGKQLMTISRNNDSVRTKSMYRNPCTINVLKSLRSFQIYEVSFEGSWTHYHNEKEGSIHNNVYKAIWRAHQYCAENVCDDLLNVLRTHANASPDVLGSVKNIKDAKKFILKEEQKMMENSRIVKKASIIKWIDSSSLQWKRCLGLGGQI